MQLPLIDNSIYETTELPFDQSLMTVPFKHALYYYFFFLYISTLNWSMDASIKPLFLWSGNSASGYKISHCRCQTAGAWTDFNLLIILFSTFVLFCFFLFLFLRIRLMSCSKHLSVISKVLVQWRSDYISRIVALFSLNSDMFPNALGSFSFTGYWNCLISKVN